MLNKNTVQCASMSLKRALAKVLTVCIHLHLTRHRSLADVLIQRMLNAVSSFPSWFSLGSTTSNSSHREHLQPPGPPTIAFVLVTAAPLRVCSPVGCPSRAENAAQRNPNCVLPAKGIINLPAKSINAWCLLPKTWRATAASVLPCRGSPQAMEGSILCGITLVNTHPRSCSTTPAQQLCYTPLTIVFGFLTGKKYGENYTCLLVGERQLSYPHVQSKGKEHFQIRGCLQLNSQNLQPISTLGMLIYPAAATSHVSCLSVTGKQLPKPLEVHISILKLRLF